jgi:hypothetical protein
MKNGDFINKSCTPGEDNGHFVSSWGGLSFALAGSGVAQSASKDWPSSSQIMQPPVHGVTHHSGLGSSRANYMTDANDYARGAGVCDIGWPVDYSKQHVV